MFSTVRQFHGTIGFWGPEEMAIRQLQTIRTFARLPESFLINRLVLDSKVATNMACSQQADSIGIWQHLNI